MKSQMTGIYSLPLGITIVFAGTGITVAAVLMQHPKGKDLIKSILKRVLHRETGDNSEQDHNNIDSKSHYIAVSNEKSLNGESLAEAITNISTEALGVAHLFKSFQSAAMCLKLYLKLYPDKKISEKNSLALSAFLELLLVVERNMTSVHRMMPNIKLIVIEGLKQSGKTKLISTIVPRLPSRYRSVPLPKEYEDIEEFFNNAAEPVAKAFQCLRNYIAVNQIYLDFSENPLENRHYFLDTYYHSTCTSTIMSHANSPDDPNNVVSAAYDWPLDLPVPNMVVYLHVPTEVRLRRFDEASLNLERSLSRSIARDEKMQIAFSLVKGPLSIAIDANADTSEVCDVTIEALGEYGFIIPKGSMFSPSSHKRSSVGVYGTLNQLP